MYFCQDIDLMAWEPGVFLEPASAHQALVREAAGTLTGTALVMASACLQSVQSGMVAAITLADGSLTQLLEVVALTDATRATVSALRGRGEEAPIAALTGGAVKVMVVSFRPQIAVIGDELLALTGIQSERATADPARIQPITGCKMATVYGVLAVLFRAMVPAADASIVAFAKRDFYQAMWRQMRLQIEMTTDSDGIPETHRPAVRTLERI